ncbi:MAG: rod shape-determining protein MreD [Deltaproteobacteria bacterium]|nr:rod shape-determining protein MreD [Deltaproteobacteria bacterium]
MPGSKRQASCWPRLFATVLTGFFLVVLSTTVFSWWAVGPLKLEPLVVVMVSAGFNLPLAPGAIAVAFLGYLADMVSGGVMGLQMAAYLAVFCLCAVAERKLEINSWPFQMGSVGLMTMLQQALVVGGLMLVRRDHLLPPNLPWVLLAQAVLNALTAPLFFAMLETMVRLLGRLWPQTKRKAA